MDKSYDINAIFAELEQALIASYKRNFDKHLRDEIKEGFSWPMWQAKKLADLQAYKKKARQLINKFSNRAIDAATGQIIENYTTGKEVADKVIRGFRKSVPDMSFGQMDRRKMDALLDAVKNDFDDAASAALRLVDDQFRKIVFKSQLAYAAGATTLPKAVDMASKTFLERGISCITYSNGNKVNIASYTEMVVRTSAKRAYLAGQGARNNELGIHLVQITSYGGCSPLCLPWQGKVFVDDVYSGGIPDGKHQKLSYAMGNGLFHPNCRHTSQPWFEGISSLPPQLDAAKIAEVYQSEQRQREIERNIRKYKRIEAGSVDTANRAAAKSRVTEWQATMRAHLEQNPFLSRNYTREKLV